MLKIFLQFYIVIQHHTNAYLPGAANVVEHKKITYKGDELYVSWPKHDGVKAKKSKEMRQVFVTKLEPEWSDDEVESIFQSKMTTSGGIVEISRTKDKEAAHITFQNPKGLIWSSTYVKHIAVVYRYG